MLKPLFFLTFVIAISTLVSCQNGTDPYQWKDFLMANRLHQCSTRPSQPRMPRSYYVPVTYFDSIPADQRIPPGGHHTEPLVVPVCNNKLVQPAALDAYEFETERYLSSVGLNIYDGAMWSFAAAALGEADEVYRYFDQIISSGETCQFADVRGDAPCKGVIVTGECQDPQHTGQCGFCYGDGTDRSLPKINAWSFRMISDYWALLGTVDERCPELGLLWTWNDYKPVLGENSWAMLLAPLQVAFMKYGTVEAIPVTDLAITMAFNFLPSLEKMLIPSLGAVYYAPKNTIVDGTQDVGFSVSTENNVSLLGGLKALRYYLVVKNTNLDKLALINNLIDNIHKYVRSSYSSDLGYFRQGGVYNPATGVFTWATGDVSFAVDCQTWTMSNVNPLLIDQWFGAGTSLNIWKKTKQLGGYNYNSVTNRADGLGFAVDNTVFSGEWTLGGINMLRIFAKLYNKPEFLDEANAMRTNIQQQLTQMQIIDGENVVGVAYANKRYYIPFGWWANPVLSTASTSWTVLVDKGYNPFFLGGEYSVDYPK